MKSKRDPRRKVKDPKRPNTLQLVNGNNRFNTTTFVTPEMREKYKDREIPKG